MDIAPFFIIAVGVAFVFLWARHYYLVHFKLNRYMLKHHEFEWKKMKQDTSWGRAPWMNFYYTKKVYNFIWRSTENYGDKNIHLQKLVIRRFLWELPLYFVVVIGVAALFIGSGILK
ncbi:MAG: hypothetical protein FP812_15345 [Desulfobacula sp.]|nr:hypothetical protein [Desulfobacula sp.]